MILSMIYSILMLTQATQTNTVGRVFETTALKGMKR